MASSVELLRLVVDLDAAKAERGLDDLQSGATNTGQAMERMGNSLDQAGVSMGQMGGSVGRVGVDLDQAADSARRLDRELDGGGRRLGDYEGGLNRVGEAGGTAETRFLGLGAGISGVSTLMSGDAGPEDYAMALADLGDSVEHTVIPAIQGLGGHLGSVGSRLKQSVTDSGGFTGSLKRMAPAVLGVGAVLAGGALAWSAWQDSQAKAKQALQAMREALRDAEGDILSLDAAFVTSRFEPWIGDLNDAGVSLDVLRSALAGNEDAIHRVEVASAEMGFQTGENLRRQLDGTSGALADQNEALGENAEFTGEAVGPAGDLADELANQVTQAEAADAMLTQYNDSLRGMFDPLLAAETALQNQQDAVEDLHAKQLELIAAVDEYGAGSLEAAVAQDELTAAEISAREAVIDLNGAATDLMIAIDEQGLSVDAARQKFVQIAVQQGLTATEAAALASQFFLTEQAAASYAGDYVATIFAQNLAQTSENIALLKAQIDAVDGMVAHVSVNFRTNTVSMAPTITFGGRFHEGGLVAGTRGQEVAGVLLGGEEVVHWTDPRHSSNLVGPFVPTPSIAGMAPVVMNSHIHFHGPVTQDSVQWVSSQVNKGIERNLVNNRGRRL